MEEPLYAMVCHDSGPFTGGTESMTRKRWIFALCRPMNSVGGYVIYLIALVLDSQQGPCPILFPQGEG
ncbi:unnamed protein product [Urochloa humidicola]